MRNWLLILVALSLPAQASAQKPMLIWSHDAEACRSFPYRAAYTLEAVPGADSRQRRAAVTADAKAAGVGHVWIDDVPMNSCVAVGYMDRRLGSCAFRTDTWEIGADETTVVAKIERKIRSTSGVAGSGLAEVRCGGVLMPPKSRDASFGVRG